MKRLFKPFSTQDLVVITMMAALGLAIKPIVTPLSQIITGPLYIPGGVVAGAFYMLWIVLAYGLMPGFTGFIAKESVVSTLQILLGTAAVSTLFTAKAALSFLVFTLLYTPCVAAIAAIRRETGSALRAALIALSQCCIAWLAAFAVYHLTLLL